MKKRKSFSLLFFVLVLGLFVSGCGSMNAVQSKRESVRKVTYKGYLAGQPIEIVISDTGSAYDKCSPSARCSETMVYPAIPLYGWSPFYPVIYYPWAVGCGSCGTPALTVYEPLPFGYVSVSK